MHINSEFLYPLKIVNGLNNGKKKWMLKLLGSLKSKNEKKIINLITINN